MDLWVILQGCQSKACLNDAQTISAQFDDGCQYSPVDRKIQLIGFSTYESSFERG